MSESKAAKTHLKEPNLALTINYSEPFSFFSVELCFLLIFFSFITIVYIYFKDDMNKMMLIIKGR